MSTRTTGEPADQPRPRGVPAPEVGPPRRSLLVKQAAFVAIVVVLGTGALSGVAYVLARSILRDQVHQRLLVIASDRRARLAAYTAQEREHVALVASRTRLRQLLDERRRGAADEASFRDETARILQDAEHSAPDLLDIRVADPAGKVITATRPDLLGTDCSADPDFLAGRAGPHIGVPRPSSGPRHAYRATLAAPARNAQGDLLGVVVADLDASRLVSTLLDGTGLGETGQVLIGTRDASGALRLLPRRPDARADEPEAGRALLEQALRGETGFATPRIDGVDVLAAYLPAVYQPGDPHPWGVVARLDASEADEPVTRLGRTLFLLEAALVLAGVAIAYLGARRLTRPIKELTEKAAALAAGDLQARVDVKSADEIGVLGSAFNRMAGELAASYGTLEQRVEERTQELARANADLEREVAERERTERTLRDSEALYHSLVESLPLNVFRKDRQGRIVFANRRFCETVQRPLDDLLGKTDHDLFPRELADKYARDDARVLATGQVFRDIEEHRRPDGTLLYVEVLKAPIRDASGAISGVQGIFWDVTAQKRAEQELEAAREAAEAASRAKSMFLANMSHEIRTPMNAILGMSELLLGTRLSSEQREFLTVVQESGESLMALINDILDFSKIEAGRLTLDVAPFDLRESLGDTMKWLAIRAHGKALELACHVAPDVPNALAGDATRLRQVVVNLVGNAIKFTDAGEVVLDVGRHSEPGDAVVLHFAVSDTGIGIPRDKLETIFDVFEQGDSSMTRRYGGTGLGLAISTRLVDLMGGRLRVESEPGRGSTFHFTARFGLARDEEIGPAPTRPATARGLRVLAVDDNATNRRILEEMLANWEMRPACAASAAQALDLLRQAVRDGDPFRLVLTDANMPETDGFTLAEQIKGDPQLGGAVIMMLTSGDRPGDIARCEAIGVAAYLLKPVKQSELLDAITAILGSAAPEEEPEALAAASPLRPLRILLAEDSLPSQKLAIALLEKQGHSVAVAATGTEALAALEREPFDLVLMDVQMPEMDGLEAAAAIRAAEKQTGAHVPIIGLTAHALKGDRERCLAAGMDDYVAKPIRARRLLDAIQAACGGSPAPEPPPAPPPQQEAVDWAEALDGVGGDPKLLLILVESVLEEVPRRMAEMRKAIADGDGPTLRRAAHTLKGSVRYFGESPAYRLAFRLEQAGRDADLAQAGQLLPALEAEMARLTPILVDYRRDRETGGTT